MMASHYMMQCVLVEYFLLYTCYVLTSTHEKYIWLEPIESVKAAAIWNDSTEVLCRK